MLERPDEDSLAPEDEELLRVLKNQLPPQTEVTEAQVQAWLEGIDHAATEGSLTWGDAAAVTVASIASVAIAFAPLMSFDASIVLAALGITYGALLRAMTRALPAI